MGNQKHQVTPLRYINRADEVSRFVRGSTGIKDVEYLMRSVKLEAEAVGIWTEENWNVKRII